MFPINSTDLSLAGVLKWLFALFSIPFFFVAFEGIVERRVTVDGTSFLAGQLALRQGLLHLLGAFVMLGISYCIWYFWQNNED